MLEAPCARLHSTSGGSSDTELKELAVSPKKRPSSSRVVMTVTPVANWARASRKWRLSNAVESGCALEEVDIGVSVQCASIMPKIGVRRVLRSGSLEFLAQRRFLAHQRLEGLGHPRPRRQH